MNANLTAANAVNLAVRNAIGGAGGNHADSFGGRRRWPVSRRLLELVFADNAGNRGYVTIQSAVTSSIAGAL